MTESRTHAVLPGADLHLLKSTIADDEFEVSVTVLRIEVESRKRLPVVYVLDANLQFAMAAQTAWLMIFARELPEMIIVGIGHRWVPFSPTHRWRRNTAKPGGDTWSRFRSIRDKGRGRRISLDSSATNSSLLSSPLTLQMPQTELCLAVHWAVCFRFTSCSTILRCSFVTSRAVLVWVGMAALYTTTNANLRRVALRFP